MADGRRFEFGGSKENDPDALRKALDKKAAKGHPFLKGGHATSLETSGQGATQNIEVERLMGKVRSLETKGTLTDLEQQELRGLQGQLAAYRRNERERGTGTAERRHEESGDSAAA